MTTSVYIVCPETYQNSSYDDGQYQLEEAQSLCRAISLKIKATKCVTLKKISPATFITSGHLDNVKAEMEEGDINLLYIDTHIKANQQRNLEKFLGKKVIDRTGLILDIFADRARTQEGRIQVDLAYKKYQKSRLIRLWTHLERQKGGGGFIGGPGEKQTELDRRALDVEIKRLEKDLKKIKSNRALQRQAREKEHFPIIALVGYTNAGKSTLFNKMTNANVLSKDMVFATLDPTMRGLKLPNGQKAIMSDTVGFIRNLPTELIAAFSATLEEVVEADIILHVQDVSNAEMQDHAETVLAILDNLGVDQSADNIFNVYNKIDILAMDDPFEYNRLKNMTDKDPQNAGISSYTGEGIDQLLSKIVNYLTRDEEDYNFELPVSDGKALSWLHDNATVLKTDYNESDKVYVSVRMGQSAHDKFVKVFGY